MSYQTFYKRTGDNMCILSRINNQLKPKEITEQKEFLYKRITYIENGKEKIGYVSLEQIKLLSKSKRPDMEVMIDQEKRYISSVLLDIYLLENQGLVYINAL